MALVTSLAVNFLGILTGTPANAGLSTGAARHVKNLAYSFTDGVGAYQGNKIFTVGARSIAASTFDTFDLSGSLLDALNNTVVFSKLRLFALIASSSNAKPIVIGGSTAAVPLFGTSTQEHSVWPGGVALFGNPTSTGWAIANGTADILKIANSATSEAVKYDMYAVGSS